MGWLMLQSAANLSRRWFPAAEYPRHNDYMPNWRGRELSAAAQRRSGAAPEPTTVQVGSATQSAHKRQRSRSCSRSRSACKGRPGVHVPSTSSKQLAHVQSTIGHGNQSRGTSRRNNKRRSRSNRRRSRSNPDSRSCMQGGSQCAEYHSSGSGSSKSCRGTDNVNNSGVQGCETRRSVRSRDSSSDRSGSRG